MKLTSQHLETQQINFLDSVFVGETNLAILLWLRGAGSEINWVQKSCSYRSRCRCTQVRFLNEIRLWSRDTSRVFQTGFLKSWQPSTHQTFPSRPQTFLTPPQLFPTPPQTFPTPPQTVPTPPQTVPTPPQTFLTPPQPSPPNPLSNPSPTLPQPFPNPLSNPPFHDILEPWKQAVLASRDVIISSQNSARNCRGFFHIRWWMLAAHNTYKTTKFWTLPHSKMIAETYISSFPGLLRLRSTLQLHYMISTELFTLS